VFCRFEIANIGFFPFQMLKYNFQRAKMQVFESNSQHPFINLLHNPTKFRTFAPKQIKS